ncbi:MAG: hypothetical protein JWM99_1536 [Verrucomicrobiales bacterium]|nr:hypothetical protein [Verrucomicrobiales bacterium]
MSAHHQGAVFLVRFDAFLSKLTGRAGSPNTRRSSVACLPSANACLDFLCEKTKAIRGGKKVGGEPRGGKAFGLRREIGRLRQHKPDNCRLL